MTAEVFMLIRTRHGKVRLVKNALSKFSEIKSIHEVYGRFDLVCQIEAENYEKLKEFIQNKIRITEHIKYTETLVVSDLEDEAPEEYAYPPAGDDTEEADDEDEEV